MFRSLGRMPWSLVWLVFAAVAFTAAAYCETPSRMDLRAVQEPTASPERAIAKIKSLGGKFGYCQRVQPLQVESQPLGFVGLPIDALPPDVPLPDPPPDLPPGELLPKSEDLPSDGVGLIADAFISPLIAPDGAPVQSVLSITIDSSWRGGDSAIALLRDVPDLVSLRLYKVTLSDAALVQIAACRQLESLDIAGKFFSTEALARFRAQRPDVRISAR